MPSCDTSLDNFGVEVGACIAGKVGDSVGVESTQVPEEVMLPEWFANIHAHREVKVTEVSL